MISIFGALLVLSKGSWDVSLCSDRVLEETDKATCEERQEASRERNHYCEFISFKPSHMHLKNKCFLVYFHTWRVMCSCVF